MNHWVYILISEIDNHWSYVGSTSDLEERLYRHAIGHVRSTKGKRPLKCIHKEAFPNRISAYQRELFLKSGFGREEKKRIIKRSGIV